MLLPANPDMGIERSTPIVTRIAITVFMAVSFRSIAGRNGIRHHLHPSARAGFNVGVIALGILTVVPIIGFLPLIPLDIRLRLLRDNHYRRRGVIIKPWAPVWHRAVCGRPVQRNPYIETKGIVGAAPGQP